MDSPDKQLQEISSGCAEIISEPDLHQLLSKAKDSGQPLSVKLGCDPSRPDLHLGHTVVLNKLRTFQELGHQVVFIIGDFTARIGDPTGKNKTRPQLTEQEVLGYAKSYQEQVFKVLVKDQTEVVFNSHWLDKLSPQEFIQLLARKTVQQLLVRDDFAKRYASDNPIFLHELLYPVMQAYDSVHLKSDIEIGGTDQKFNLLLGRELQKSMGQKPQVVVLLPLLEGLDGVQKMSKSYDNYIALNDSPQDMFGKTMSVSDEHMFRFYQLLTTMSVSELDDLRSAVASGKKHPMAAKKELASYIVARYWGDAEGTHQRQLFEERFSQKKTPDDMPECAIDLDESGQIDVLALSVELGFSPSKSDARRVLKQGGMKIDDQPLTTPTVQLTPGQSYVFKQGKLKIVRLTAKSV